MYVEYRLTNVSTAKTGANYDNWLISISFERPIPMPIPTSEEVVNSETDLPAISAMLFLLAKRMLIWALEADAIKKQMFFPILAVDAKKRKRYGNLSVMISIRMDRLRVAMAKKRHFLTSSSK